MDHLIEMSLSQLLQKTITAFPDTQRRQHATDTVSVTDIQLIPAAGSLLAKGTVRGAGGQPYQCAVQFDDVVYDPENTSAVATFVSGEKEYKIAQLNKNTADVKVRCTCLDFRFRFAHYNHSVQALYGKQPELYAKVPNSNREKANPTQSPGMCKHIIDFVDSLENSGLF